MIGALVYAIGFSYSYSNLDDFYDKLWYENEVKFPIMLGVCLLIILPLCLLKNISKMRFSSTLGVIAIISIVLIIIIQFPWYFDNYINNIYDEKDPTTHINIIDITKGFDEKLYFFTGSSTLFYAYSCHIAAYPIYKTLKNNIMRRTQKVFRRTIILDGCLYSIVGLIGYLSTPKDTPDLIIDRYQYFSNDVIMLIGKACFIVALLTKIPANYNSFRLSVLSLIWNTNEVSTKKYFI